MYAFVFKCVRMLVCVAMQALLCLCAGVSVGMCVMYVFVCMCVLNSVEVGILKMLDVVWRMDVDDGEVRSCRSL